MEPRLTDNQEIIRLTPPPRATKDNIVGHNYGIRPYRKGGLRLERQLFRNKTFYHNYGHGGAGVSLAYGSCKYIVDQFMKDVAPSASKEVAVLGSGYMGLMESILLTDLGFNVTVYAKAFPRKVGMYQDSPCITSQVAGGLWLPFGLFIPDKDRHFALGKTTYEYYKDCIENKKYKGLSYKDMYYVNVENLVDEVVAPGILVPRQVKVDFGNGEVSDGWTYTTILMDGDIFLHELFEEATKKGIKFVDKEFHDILDLCELQQTYVFNCTGWGSRTLFNDTNVIPIVGHLLYLKKDPRVDYFLSVGNKAGTKKIATYPQANKIALGISYEERGWLEQPDPESLKMLAENLDEFWEERVVVKRAVPKL